MLKKGVFIVLIAIMVGLLYDLTNVYVHEGFERPFVFKAKVAAMKTLSFLAIVGNRLNLGTEPALFKLLIDYTSALPKYLRPKDNSVQIEDVQIEEIHVRIYRPSKREKDDILPSIIYYHGGAYILGDVDMYDTYLYEICKRTDTIIFSINYRRAPEFPFPIPLNDCYNVTKVIFKSHKTFGIDKNRVILSGDSAGGHAVASISQRLALEKEFFPKAQLLIYPWLQMFSMWSASRMEYSKKGFLVHSHFSMTKHILWLVGIVDGITEEMENAIKSNNLTLLVEDETIKKEYLTYLDINNIPEEYRKGRRYYDEYASEKIQSRVFPTKLDDTNILVRDKKFAESVRKLLSPEASPGLADDNILKQLPKAYFVIVEWDGLKDDGLLYAGRLRKNGVPVEIGFYEHAYHGSLTFIDELYGYTIAREILNDIVRYINNNK